MNKLINTDQTGGFPLKTDDLRWFLGQVASDAGIYQALNALLLPWGTDFIVQGCVAAGSPGAITEGWIMISGNLTKVDAHTGTNNYYVQGDTDSESRTFKNGSTYNVHRERRATCTSLTGSLRYDGDRLEDLINQSIQTNTTGGLKCKVVDIGDWNMNVSAAGTAEIAVTHGISWDKIRSVDVTIRNDANNLRYPLNFRDTSDTGGGTWTIDATYVRVAVITSGVFDTAAFDTAASYNRGTVTIWYEA